MVIVWLLVAMLIATVVVYVGFLAYCGAKLIDSQGVTLPADFRLVVTVTIWIAAIADVVFNWTRGTLMFRELRGTTFSSHIQWRVDHGHRDPLTLEWVRILNAGEKGHIRVTPELEQP
ncbi:MAG: hypothetical protein ABI640_12865 [Gammaproteobacteria bacterium]